MIQRWLNHGVDRADEKYLEILFFMYVQYICFEYLTDVSIIRDSVSKLVYWEIPYGHGGHGGQSCFSVINVVLRHTNIMLCAAAELKLSVESNEKRTNYTALSYHDDQVG